MSETGISGLAELLPEVALALLPLLPGGLDRHALGVNGRDGVHHVIRAQTGGLLLLFQQGEHFAVLLQLVPKALDQFLQYNSHCDTSQLGKHPFIANRPGLRFRPAMSVTACRSIPSFPSNGYASGKPLKTRTVLKSAARVRAKRSDGLAVERGRPRLQHVSHLTPR